jgi:dihydrofolate reductase
MGANLDQELLAAGLVDEIRIHLVNVLLGGGRRLFDRLPERVELEQTGVTESEGLTHIEYRVVRRRQPVGAAAGQQTAAG